MAADPATPTATIGGLARSKPIVVAGASAGTFLVLLLTSGLNIMIPSIRADLSLSDASVSWVLAGYTLAFAMFALPGGALADRFGAHRIFALGVVVFAAFSAVAAGATSGAWVIVGTFGEGAGAALVLPAALALIEYIYRDEPRRLGHVIGIWAGANALGAALGPVVCGAIVSAWSWRWAFLVVGGLGVVVVAAGWLVFPRIAASTRAIDIPGMSVMILLLGVVVFTAHSVPHLHWWQTLAAVVLAAGLAGVFVAVERRATEPMLPLAQLRDGPFSGNAVVTVIGTAAFFGPLYIISIGLQERLGMTPLAAGVALLPLAGGNLVGALAAGRVQHALGIRKTMIIGSVLLVLSVLPVPYLFERYAWFWPALVVLGVGWGFVVPSTSAAGLVRAMTGKEGVASGVTAGGRELGAALAAVTLLPLGLTTGLLMSAMVGVLSLAVAVMFVRRLGTPAG